MELSRLTRAELKVSEVALTGTPLMASYLTALSLVEDLCVVVQDMQERLRYLEPHEED